MATIISKFLEFQGVDSPALITYGSDFKAAQSVNWDDYVKQSLNFGRYMKKNATKNVAIHAFNCPEWFYAAMGSLTIKRYFCGIYATNRDEQCMHIINQGECDLLVVESHKTLFSYYENILQQLKDINIKIIIINRPSEALNEKQRLLLADLDITFWDQLDLLNNDKYTGITVDVNSVTPDDVCTLIFTSGTTGNPKAVEVTHQNIMTVVKGILDRFEVDRMMERIVSYLPLSHIAGQAIDMYVPIMCGAEIHFARPDALKGTLRNTLLEVHPTIFLGIPRVWEKFKDALVQKSEESYAGGTRKRLIGQIMRGVKSIEYYYNTTDNWMVSSLLYIPACVTALVTREIKKAIGLDQCKYFASGAAPISKDTLQYYASIGIPILEIYGMTETAGGITVSNPRDSLRGSCGTPITDVEVIIDEKNDEILVRGGNVFKKYHNYDGDNGIDADGYLHTGDCGRIDDYGCLYITGRIKELIITAGGQNVPPLLIEDKIKTYCKSNSQFVLIGDRKPFLSMLVFNGPDEKQIDEETVKAAITKYNTHDSIDSSQNVQTFKIIREALTLENGVITDTMKLKRKKIVERYNDDIESMYLIKK